MKLKNIVNMTLLVLGLSMPGVMFAAQVCGGGSGDSGGTAEIEKCPVCYESYTDTYQAACGHKMCLSCVILLAHHTAPDKELICPLCRRTMAPAVSGSGDASDQSQLIALLMLMQAERDLANRQLGILQIECHNLRRMKRECDATRRELAEKRELIVKIREELVSVRHESDSLRGLYDQEVAQLRTELEKIKEDLAAADHEIRVLSRAKK